MLAALSVQTTYCTSEQKSERTEPDDLAVVIVGPGDDSQVVTLANKTHVEGVVLGEAERVVWETDAGAHGEAAVNEGRFLLDSVPVHDGRNQISVRADNGLQSSSDALIVYHNHAYVFTAAPLSEMPAVLTGAVDVVRFSVALADGSPAQKPLNLQRLQDGKVIDLGPMWDDGAAEHGDDIPNDGIYSTRVTFEESQEATMQLQAVAQAPDGHVDVSPLREFKAVFPVSEGEIDALQLLEERAGAAYDGTFDETGSHAKAAETAKTTLEADPAVEQVQVSDSGYSLWIVTKGGLMGAVNRAPGNQRSAAGSRTCEANHASEAVCSQTSALENEADIPHNQAAFLSNAYSDEFGIAEQAPIKKWADQASCPKYETTPIYLDSDVTFDRMRTLHRYGLISLVTHGDTFTGFKYNAKTKKSTILGLGNNENAAKTLLWLRGGPTPQNLNRKDVQVALRTGALLHDSIDFAITATFFRDWVHRFPKSLIYMGACRSGRTGDIPRLMLRKGASAVLGYTDYVDSGWAQDQGEKFFDCMFNGTGLQAGEIPTTRSCYHWAKEPKGDLEPAEFRIFPRDHNARLIGPRDFQNGGFENDFLGWRVKGDSRVIPKLGPTAAPNGKKMAILSTGLGLTTGLGSISQSMCLRGTKPRTLSFRWRMYSAEFKKYCDTSFQDTFRVAISSNGKTTYFPKAQHAGDEAGYQIKELCDKVVPSDFEIPVLKKNSSANQDPDGTFMTEWQTALFELDEANIGSEYTLKLEVLDRGDSAYDTAVVVDNIEVNP